MGMTYEDYWYGRADKVVGVSKAFRMKLEKQNSDMHLQGAYIYDALLSALSGFGGKPKNYTEKPFEVLKPTKNDLQRQREQSERDIDAFFGMLERKYGDKT